MNQEETGATFWTGGTERTWQVPTHARPAPIPYTRVPADTITALHTNCYNHPVRKAFGTDQWVFKSAAVLPDEGIANLSSWYSIVEHYG